MFQGQIRNYLSRPIEIEQFLSFNPIFPLALSKLRLIHPHKNYIFEITKDMVITSQSLAILA